MKRSSKPMRTYERTGVGIVNPYGQLWSDEVYDTPEAAIAHLRRFWNGVPAYDESRWSLTMVLVKVTAVEPVQIWKVRDYLAKA